MNLLTRSGLRQIDRVEPDATGNYQLEAVNVINPCLSRQSKIVLGVKNEALSFQDVRHHNTVRLTEFADCFALPGLVDMHVHLPPNNALQLHKHAALAYLLHGVTTVREAGDLDGTAVNGMKSLGNSFPIPRILHCGPFISATKKQFKNTILLDSVSDADRVVKQVKETGAEFVKLYDRLTIEMIAALRNSAENHDLQSLGHVPAKLSYEESGVPEVQHFFGVPEPAKLEMPTLMHRNIDWQTVTNARLRHIAEVTLEQGIENTPTLVAIEGTLCYRKYHKVRRRLFDKTIPKFYLDIVWNPDSGVVNTNLTERQLHSDAPEALIKKQKLVKMLYEDGAKLYLGTDTMQPCLIPGQALQREMHLFAEAGIPIEEVWRLATAVAGEKLKRPQLGKLEEGAPADVLLFADDPTENLDNLVSLKAIIRDGKLYKTETLQEAFDATIAYFRSPLISRFSNWAVRRTLARTLNRR